MSKVILITGCSSGIGKATSELAASRGHTVVATVPNESLFPDVPDNVAARYVIDVCDEATIAIAVESAVKEFGRIDVLINNAGYCQPGPVEMVSGEKVRKQFDVNVMGPLAMIRHVTPFMRQAGRGCIINIASMLGLMSMPLVGIYASSKFAVEGFSHSLRMELKPFGIDVVLIEPGFINTGFAETAAGQTDHSWRDDASYPYYSLLARSTAKTSEKNVPGANVDDVARVLVTALESEKPRTRYKITAEGKLLPRLANWLPDRWFDSLVMKIMT